MPPRNLPDMNIAVPHGSTEDTSVTTEYSKELSALNWINLVAFVLNVGVTYGVGVLGWIGNGTNAQLSEKYQTLVTPNATAFSIWAIIFISQGLFTGVQLLPSFRQLPLVQNGVGYSYAFACFFQMTWTFAFAYEIIGLSAFFMIALWLSLIRLLIAQYYTMANGTWLEFFLLKFPFAIHCGWITAASALNINVLLVSQNVPAFQQLSVGILSLAILHAISVWVVFALQKPNYTLALVLAWATYWIHAELQSPVDSIVERFGEATVQGVSSAAEGVAIVILLQVTLRFFWTLVRSFELGESIDSNMTALLLWPTTPAYSLNAFDAGTGTGSSPTPPASTFCAQT